MSAVTPSSSGLALGGAPPGFNVSELSGPLIVAYLLHWGLFGTLCIQVYLYYLAFPHDRRTIKYVVYGVFIIEVIQTILVTHDAFAIFGYGFSEFKSLTDMHMDWFTVPVMSGLVAFIGQAFYAYRIRVLSNSKLVPGFILLVSLTSSVAAFMTGVYSFQAGNVVTLYQLTKTNIVVGIWCAGAALGDISIAVCMTYYLSQKDSGFGDTHSVVSLTTLYLIVNIDLFAPSPNPALIALLNLILFYAFPGKGYYGTPALIMPKLYANTVLMVLNARIKILGGRGVYMSTFDEDGLGGARLRTDRSAHGFRGQGGEGAHCKTCQCNHDCEPMASQYDLESAIRFKVHTQQSQQSGSTQTTNSTVPVPASG
ncbi:hypothetical protein BDP27DRAFT_1416970 [Rhodocollybia butyracea]|uniref:DUF6534 domain-containing protein n=1 Tax=Rhodocollybia butyracea TaxID=206335 RepID=A0A9P5Q1T3_9AGAR|nr:hypothetical protein BDP27DRAFT_1416970 [Rhodocollybia butyracea]